MAATASRSAGERNRRYAKLPTLKRARQPPALPNRFASYVQSPVALVVCWHQCINAHGIRAAVNVAGGGFPLGRAWAFACRDRRRFAAGVVSVAIHVGARTATTLIGVTIRNSADAALQHGEGVAWLNNASYRLKH